MMAGTMNKQELAKHQKNLKKLNKVFRKQGDQMVPVPDYIKGTLTRKLYENITPDELNAIEAYADKLFAKYDVDVEFTKHFAEVLIEENVIYKKNISNLQLEGLSSKEKDIVDDILGEVNKLQEIDLDKVKEKLKYYGRKGLLTLSILLSVANSLQANPGVAKDVINTGIEMINPDQQTDFYSAVLGYTQELLNSAMEKGDIDMVDTLKEVKLHYETLRNNKTPKPLSNKAEKVAQIILKSLSKTDNIAYYVNYGSSIKTIKEDDPKVGTGKKPKGSGRRLYTDEDPTDTVKVKFSSRQDIVDTLNKKSFKVKSHARQSQIINLIHQRVRAAYNRAKDPAVKKRLKTALEYAEQRKEASKKKTERLKNQKNEMYGIQSPIYRAKDVSDVAFHLGKIYGGDNPAKKKSIKESQTYVLDTPKYNNLPVDKVYYQLSSLVKEIKLTKDNATEIIGTPTKGDFKVGEIEYTYNIVKKSSPYKDNEDFYLIEFDEKEGKGDSEPTKNAKESYIKILSTLYKVILNFLEKEQPTYFGISALDKSGYWNVYNQLTKQNQIPGYSRKDAGLKFTTNSEETGKMVILKKNQNMKETKLFSKEWWGGVIDEILTEGGAAGHMAHPFDLPNVTKGSDLIQTFEKAADSLEKEPGSVKIDGVNASIRLGNFDSKRQFVMDRGSKKELDIKGVTKDDLEARFGAGHGMIKAGGDVLDIFNDALKTTQPELTKLGLWDDPNIMFNMEYVTGKTNVQEYEKNFLAIHGLLKIEMKEVEGKRGTLTQRVTTEQPYNTADLQSYLNKLVPFAEKKGFEVYGSVPTTFTKSPDFNKVLNTQYTIEFTNKKETKSLKNWLKDVDYIPKTDRLKMNLETGGTKDVGALSKQVYFAVFGGENVEDLFDNEQDVKKAIQGAITYLATEKLGDAILDVLDSPMGSVNNHEGVVIRDKSISPNPFKITGKFITGGVSSQFQQKENINENEGTFVNFDIEDIRGYKVVLATLNDKIVGKLRLIPYPEYYQVENVLVDKDLRGMGIGKNLYLLARKELGKPIHSDKYRTPDAEYLWKSLVKSGDAQAVEDGTYVMKEETTPSQYNVADEIGTSMYTSDLRENKVPYDKITNDITRQIYDILARYNEGDMPYGQAYEEDLELNFPTIGGIEPLDATITIIPKRRSIYAHEITGEADENGIYIRVEFLKDELPEILNDMMPYIKGVVRHELEHIGQYYTQNDPKTRDLFEPDSYVEAQTFEEYTLKPEEINAYVKELNRIRKTQNISFRDALKNYFRDYKENFRSEEGMRATMKAWLQRAKELNIID
jgi:hypothetical protein